MSGVKSKVEKLCQSFEIDEGNVDLSEHHPNVIANVLKLYLRQLPDPLLTYKLYPDLIALVKVGLFSFFTQQNRKSMYLTGKPVEMVGQVMCVVYFDLHLIYL